MGAWGTRNFENDESQDWIFDVIDSRDGGQVTDTLARVINKTEQLEMQDCAEALAAAEVVAALTGKASDDFPEDPLDKLDSLNLIATKNLRTQAISTVNKILEQSEMKNSWEGEGKGEEWLAVQQNLLKRLEL